MHLKNALEVSELAEKFYKRSQMFGHVHMWFLDHMASKKIPKYKKETQDSWSKDHLTIHLAGELCGKDNTVHYGKNSV